MLNTFEITTAAHWKAFSHPLRLGILGKLREGERTNEELAKSLGVESGKLYFHTKQLVLAGMIEPAGTRQKGPITEKLYRAAAKNYSSPPPAMDTVQPPFADMVSAALSMYQAAWRQDPGQMDTHLGYSVTISLPEYRIREVAEQLLEILKGMTDERTNEPGSQPVTATLLLYALSPSLVHGATAEGSEQSAVAEDDKGGNK